MPCFLELPHEITEQALIHADVKDVASVAQVCRLLRRIVYFNDSHLWRGLFLKIFDDPRKTQQYLSSTYTAAAQSGNLYREAAGGRARYDWQGELQRRIVARNVLLSPRHASSRMRVPRRESINALNTIVEMILAAITVPPAELSQSYDLYWIEDLLTHMDAEFYDGYGLYSPFPPSDLETAWIVDGGAAGDPGLFRRTPLESRLSSVSRLDNHSPYILQPHSVFLAGPSMIPLSSSWISDKDATAGDNFDHENNCQHYNFDNLQHLVAQERVIRARLRLLRGYGGRQKVLVPMGPVDSQSDPKAEYSRRLATDLRLYARARVYNLRRYTPSNDWGPFIADPAIEGGLRVDWEQVEAILIDVAMNIFDHVGHDHQYCPRIFNPFGLESSRAYTAPGGEAHTFDFAPDGDWAGITGSWSRIISFCDYRDLRVYNDLLDTPSSTRYILADPEFSEAVHVLSVNMRVTEIGDASTCHPAFPNRPRLGIAGDTSYKGAEMSKLGGCVSMTPEGVIRWDFQVSLDGQPRWSSVGIQIGEAGSANGVIGIWTGIDHEAQDPAGPFWFWKVA